MVGAQVFPFIALQIYDGDAATKDNLTIFLGASLALWLLLFCAFFCTIDLKYMQTFFSTRSGPQVSERTGARARSQLGFFDLLAPYKTLSLFFSLSTQLTVSHYFSLSLRAGFSGPAKTTPVSSTPFSQ